MALIKNDALKLARSLTHVVIRLVVNQSMKNFPADVFGFVASFNDQNIQRLAYGKRCSFTHFRDINRLIINAVKLARSLICVVFRLIHNNFPTYFWFKISNLTVNDLRTKHGTN